MNKKNFQILGNTQMNLEDVFPTLHRNVKYKKFPLLLLYVFHHHGPDKDQDILPRKKVKIPVPLCPIIGQMWTKSDCIKIHTILIGFQILHLSSHPAFRLEPHVRIEYSKHYKTWTMRTNRFCLHAGTHP